MIEVENLSKKFKDRVALAGVSFTVGPGTIYGYLGPNGAGKTTTIRILTGLTRRDGGTVLLNGFDIRQDPIKCKAQFGLVPQHTNLDAELTVEENLSIHGRLHHMARPDIVRRTKELLDYVEMARALRGVVRFRWIGNVVADAQAIVAANKDIIDFIPRQPEHDLPRFYNETDGYVFPTIQDGYAVVLAQAKAACVPIAATENSAAPDIHENGMTGRTLPIRRPDLFVEKVRAWNADRNSMAAMVERLWMEHDMRDWSDVADDFIAIVQRAVQMHTREGLWTA